MRKTQKRKAIWPSCTNRVSFFSFLLSSSPIALLCFALLALLLISVCLLASVGSLRVDVHLHYAPLPYRFVYIYPAHGRCCIFFVILFCFALSGMLFSADGSWSILVPIQPMLTLWLVHAYLTRLPPPPQKKTPNSWSKQIKRHFFFFFSFSFLLFAFSYAFDFPFSTQQCIIYHISIPPKNDR